MFIAVVVVAKWVHSQKAVESNADGFPCPYCDATGWMKHIFPKEKLKECTCDCHKYHNTVLHDGLDNCVCKGTGWVKENK